MFLPARRSLLLAALAASATRAAATSGPPLRLGRSAELGVAGEEAAGRLARHMGSRSHGGLHLALDAPARPGGEARLLQSVQDGALPMAMVSAGALAALGAQAFHALELPALFRDDGSAADIGRAPVAAELLGRLEPLGLRGVRLFAGGALALAGERPLLRTADLAGTTVAMAPSPVVRASLARLGAVPVEGGEALPVRSLRTRLTDAAIDLPAALLGRAPLGSPRLAISLPPLGRRFGVVVAHPGFWNGLAPDARAGIEAALDEALKPAEAQAAQRTADLLERAVVGSSASVHALSAADALAWRQALYPVHREFETAIGRPMLVAIYRAARFAPPSP